MNAGRAENEKQEGLEGLGGGEKTGDRDREQQKYGSERLDGSGLSFRCGFVIVCGAVKKKTSFFNFFCCVLGCIFTERSAPLLLMHAS